MAGGLEADVVDALRLGMIRPQEIAQRLQCSGHDVRTALDSLAARGLVAVRGREQGSPWWELTPEGHRRR